jgi:hypothetical protein
MTKIRIRRMKHLEGRELRVEINRSVSTRINLVAGSAWT